MSHFERNYFEHRFIIWLTCIAVAKLAKTFHDNWFFFHQLLFSKPIFWFSEKLVELWWSLHVDITKQDGPQGSRNVWKSEGASSNVVKIICSLPSDEIGFADLPKFFLGGGWGSSPLPLGPYSPETEKISMKKIYQSTHWVQGLFVYVNDVNQFFFKSKNPWNYKIPGVGDGAHK